MMFWLAISVLCGLVLIILLAPSVRGGAGEQVLKSPLLIAAVILAIPMCSFLLYAHWGAYSSVQQAENVAARIAEVKETINRTGSRQTLIAQFEQHVQRQPGDPKAWYLLGKLAMRDGQVQKAISALRQSEKLKPNDPEILLALAQALYLENHNTLSTESRQLLEKALKFAPESPEVLNLLAIDVYNKGQYNQAVRYFERLLPYYPPESEDGQRLLEILAKAQRLAAGGVAPAN